MYTCGGWLVQFCAHWPKIAPCLAGSECESASGAQGGNGLAKPKGIWLMTGGSVVEEGMHMGCIEEYLELILDIMDTYPAVEMTGN